MVGAQMRPSGIVKVDSLRDALDRTGFLANKAQSDGSDVSYFTLRASRMPEAGQLCPAPLRCGPDVDGSVQISVFSGWASSRVGIMLFAW